MKKILALAVLSLISIACSNDKNLPDAYGNFETIEVMVSAEATGKLNYLEAIEGKRYNEGDVLGIIDTVQLSLKKDQISANMQAVRAKAKDIQSQVEALLAQKANLVREKNRLERMFKDAAATQKQLDDINGLIDVNEKSIIATRTALQNANDGVLSELKPLSVQSKQLDDNLNKSIVRSPISGQILTRFCEKGEVVSYGKPICKIADTDKMILKAYVSGTQISDIKAGQTVKVFIDKNKDEKYEYSGTVTWISEKAEFTPKIVQTKEERINLVYPVKITVKNDGKIKIGMPGEVKFK